MDRFPDQRSIDDVLNGAQAARNRALNVGVQCAEHFLKLCDAPKYCPLDATETDSTIKAPDYCPVYKEAASHAAELSQQASAMLNPEEFPLRDPFTGLAVVD